MLSVEVLRVKPIFVAIFLRVKPIYVAIFFRYAVFEPGDIFRILGSSSSADWHPWHSVISWTKNLVFCVMASVTAAFLTGLSKSCQVTNPEELGSRDAAFVLKARRVGTMFGTRLFALWYFDRWCIFAPCNTASITLGSLVALSLISLPFGSLDIFWMAVAWGVRVVDQVRLRWDAAFLNSRQLPSRFASLLQGGTNTIREAVVLASET